MTQKLLLLVFVNHFGVDDVFFVIISGVSLSRTLVGLGIERFTDLGLRLLQLLERSLNFFVVVLFLKGFLERINVRLNFSLDVFGQLLVVFFEQLVNRVRGGFGSVACFGSFATLLILFRVGFGILDHALDRKSTRLNSSHVSTS